MGWYQWCLHQSHQLHPSPMTATLGAPTGKVDGLCPRRHGAARTRKWAVWSPNPMIAMLGIQIGRLAGPFLRRHGAARTSKRVALSQWRIGKIKMDAALVLGQCTRTS